MKAITTTLMTALLMSMSLTGCSLSNRVKVSAVDYNRAVASSNDKILLLNIVRASQGRPLHFSRIGKISGSFQQGVDNKLYAPFGDVVSPKYSISPNITIVSRDNFDIEPLNGKEFWQGLLKPLSMNQLAYFWNQGASKELLIHLMIEEANIKLPNEPVCRVSTIVRYPNTWEAFDAFAALFAESQHESINLATANVGKPMQINHMQDIAYLKSLLDKGLAFNPVSNGRVQMSMPQNVQEFDLKTGNVRPPSLNKQGAKRCTQNQIATMRRIAIHASQSKDSVPERVTVQVSFRSVAGIIDYLGKHADAQRLGQPPLQMQGYYNGKDNPPITLFQLNNTTDKAAISVQDNGEEYAIPHRKNVFDQSLQAFSILNNLMGLQIEGGKFEPTQSIRFIGQ